jgi:phosphatidylinositol alpha 1,6-mannosyltransferase
MRIEPRVAFFPDSFVEVNGVAHTSRQLVAFAERRNLPMLCVHGGGRTEQIVEGRMTKLSLRRGNFGFGLEADFRHDLLFWRHAKRAVTTPPAGSRRLR